MKESTSPSVLFYGDHRYLYDLVTLTIISFTRMPHSSLPSKIPPPFGINLESHFHSNHSVMSFIDRTEEFKLATNVHMHDSVLPSVSRPPPSFSVSKFSKVTASLSEKVSKTTLKLQRLTERNLSREHLIRSGSEEKLVRR